MKIINDHVSFFSKVPRKPVGSDGDRNTAYGIFVGEGGGGGGGGRDLNTLDPFSTQLLQKRMNFNLSE